MHRRKTATAAVAVAAAALLALSGSADAATPTGTVPTGDGARALCKRAPKIDRRIERALTRLNGSAATRGSVARLEQRVANAKSAGHTAIAGYLGDRLAYRKSLVPALQKAKTDIAQVETWCKANDNGKGAGGDGGRGKGASGAGT